MLLDVLGALIGFAGVMLLLSLIVTSLGQASQHLLRLRGRNLQVALADVLERIGKGKGWTAPALASEILRDAALPPSETGARVARNVDKIGGPVRWMRSAPSLVWLSPDELDHALRKASTPLSAAKAREARELFEKSQERMTERFKSWMRYLAIFWAIAVAGVFQISAPLLLRDLSTDPALRARYLAETATIQAQGAEAVEQLRAVGPAPVDALVEMARRHPRLAAVLEEVSGEGRDVAQLEHEIRDVLRDVPGQREALVGEYRQILAEMRTERVGGSLDVAEDQLGQLARIDIVPWPHGWSFYGRFGNVLGVLITALLLTLGAPFWFDAIKVLTSLRDKIALARGGGDGAAKASPPPKPAAGDADKTDG